MTATKRMNEHHVERAATNTSMNEPKQLDIEDAIRAVEDAEETQPSEDEDAVATSEEEQRHRPLR